MFRILKQAGIKFREARLIYLGRGGEKEKRKGKTKIKIFGPNNWGYGMRDI